MTDFSIGEVKYQAAKLNARRQFHVVRRLLPALSGLMSAGELAELAKGGDKTMSALLEPFARAVGGMSDQDADFIIDTCLSVVSRQQPGGGWAPLLAQGGGIMFDDVDLAGLLRISFEVLKDNLSGFFGALQQMSPSAPQA